MTRDDLGPPEKDEGRAHVPAATTYTYTTSHHHEASSRHSRRCSGRGGGLVVRRATALRMPPLGMCGCVRDPDVDRHRCRDTEPSDKQVDGYRDAVGHLRDLGLTPAGFTDELRLLWRRGGQDRRLAVEVAQDWGLAG